MPKQRTIELTTAVLSLIAICLIAIGAWDIFPRAKSQTLDRAAQENVSAGELSAAIEARREASARLTRSASFDQKLRKLSDEAQKKGTVPVIVKLRAAFRPEGQISNAAEALAQRKVIEEAQDQLLSRLRYVPSTLKKYKYWPYIAASVDAAGLEQLQASSEVLAVGGDKAMRLALSESLFRVGAQRAWAAEITGMGKTIAVLDSGVDKNHSWLSGKVVSEACYSTNDSTAGYSSLCPDGVAASTAPNSGVPCTVLGGFGDCGHGTHVAGIAAGSSGVAYDANVISIQVMSFVEDFVACREQASCLLARTSDVISALGRVYELRAAHDIAAVNLSLASDGYENFCDSEFEAMSAAISTLRSVNIATVVASGNDFLTDRISYPACISSAVSVGATEDGSVPDTLPDAVAEFSNSASILHLLAPGSLITSSIPGGGVTGGSGTSVAAAHVSGAWAMLKEKYPAATVDQVLNKLTTFGVNITDPRNGLTKPRIQIDAALEVTVPPDNWVGEYYNNRDLAGAPVLTRPEGNGFIDRYFNGVSPAPGSVGAEHYSVRWTRKLTLTAGTYRFSITGDDGVRLFIDNKLRKDEWRNQPATSYNFDIPLTAGNHDIKLEYYQHTGAAQVRLIWGILNPSCSQTVPAIRWKGEYFNNANLAGDPLIVQDDGINNSLNFTWGANGPSSACNLAIFADYFSVKWTRRVDFAQGVHRFTVSADNGVRLWVDNVLKIDRWTDTAGTNTADVQLSQDEHDIRLEYFENVGSAAVSLSWERMLPPTNLTTVALSAVEIKLNWADNSNFEDGFKIERWNGSSYSQIKTVGANVREYIDPGLTPSTTYSYRVRAFTSGGDSAYSNESSATTLSCTYSVSPASATIPVDGEIFNVNVTTPSGCQWTANSNNWWISVLSGGGVGSGVAQVFVSENSSGVRRTGSLTVAGKNVSVSQTWR
jgi:subtilisin